MSGASASVPRPRVDAEPSVSNNNIQENSETPDNWQIEISSYVYVMMFSTQ